MIRVRHGNIILAYPERRIMVVRLWPAPAAWARDPHSSAWVATHPPILYPECIIAFAQRFTLLYARRSFRPYRGVCSQEVRKAFRAIPERCRMAISPFHSRQWHLLSGLARIGDPLAEILAANSASVWMLASSCVFHPCIHSMRTIRRLTRRRRPLILKYLGFEPASEATLKRLERVPAGTVSLSFLWRLRDVPARPDKHRLLGFMPAITPVLLEFFLNDLLFAHASPGFLIELAQTSDPASPPLPRIRLVLDIHEMTRLLHEESKVRFRSLRQMFALHDSLVEQTLQEPGRNGLTPFPPPPIEGTDAITPIRSMEELYEERRATGHCAFSYARRILTRQSYLSHLANGDEHATLELCPSRCAPLWELAQIRGRRNSPVGENTVRRALLWLQKNQAVKERAVSLEELELAATDPLPNIERFDDEAPF